MRAAAATLIALAAACASCGGGGDSNAPAPTPTTATAAPASAPAAPTAKPTGTEAATSSERVAAPATGGASSASPAVAEAPAAVPSTPETRQARNKVVLEDAKRTIADPRFSAFRSLAEPYLAVMREMRPLDEKFAAGTISESERATYWKLDARKSELWAPLHQHMYDARWSKDDRRAMGQWLMLTAQESAAR
ncbi:MAG: hypothetical protein JNM94_01115 [Phycisphaerae bacterium]|nr:hypothetical protein [Phycisphaerae bacterium]